MAVIDGRLEWQDGCQFFLVNNTISARPGFYFGLAITFGDGEDQE